MDRIVDKVESGIRTASYPSNSYPKNETADVGESLHIPNARSHNSTATIMDFELGLKSLIGKQADLRPFVCDGSPLACEVFIVGFTPATTMSSDFWQFWETGEGFNKAAWFEAYKQERQTRPLEPGKTRRDPVGDSRRVIDWVLESVAPIHCLETSICSAPAQSATDLPLAARVTAPFEFLLAKIKPQVIVAHGEDAVRHLKNMAPSAHVIPVPSFSSGWSRAHAYELGLKIKAACDDAQEPASSKTSAKIPDKQTASKPGRHATNECGVGC